MWIVERGVALTRGVPQAFAALTHLDGVAIIEDFPSVSP